MRVFKAGLVILLGAGLLVIVFYWFGGGRVRDFYLRTQGMRTVNDVIEMYAPAAEENLRARFAAAELSYPPRSLVFIALTQEKLLEVWASDGAADHFVASWPILAASGQAGPKLRQGDLQVPEGFYRLAGLNPNSSFHLSMKISYPNDFDLQMAGNEGRTNLGGDIFIHGRAVSIGCLAMGDAAIEELFVLVARVGFTNVEVLMLPYDFRRQLPPDRPQPAWLPDLYQQLHARLKDFKSG